MNKKNTKVFLLLLSLSCFQSIVYATDYLSGYVIKKNSDTIYCQIKDNEGYSGERRWLESQKGVDVFIKDRHVVYQVNELLEYSYQKDGQAIVFKTLNQILKVCEWDSINLPFSSNTFVLESNFGSRILSYEYTEKKLVYDLNSYSGSPVKTNIINHKVVGNRGSKIFYVNPSVDQLLEMLRHCPDIYNEVRTSSLRFKGDLTACIDEYNNWYDRSDEKTICNADILTSETKSEGIYLSFNDFRANNPTIQGVSFEDKGGYLLTADKKKIRDYWGYCINGEISFRMVYNGSLLKTVPFNIDYERYTILPVKTKKQVLYYFMDINDGGYFFVSNKGLKEGLKKSEYEKCKSLKTLEKQLEFIQSLNQSSVDCINRP